MSKKKTPNIETFAGIKIRYRPDRNRYFIQIRREGLKHTESFATIEAARLKCQQLHNEQVNHGLAAFDIDASTRHDASEAVKILAGRSTLVEAVKFWAMHHPDGSATTMKELADQYIADLTRRKCRPRTLDNIKHRLGKLNADYGDNPACTITTANILQWLELRGGGPVNQDNFRRAFRAAFNFARKRGIVTMNPVEAIEAIRVDDAMPEYWTAEQVEGVLRAAQAFAPGMVPMLAVMAFAGLRPDEAAALNWSNIHHAEKSIRVLPTTSKTRKGRLVEMPDSLTHWLAPYHRKTELIAPATVTIARWRVRLAAVLVLGIDEAKRRLDQHEGLKGTEIKGLGLGWSAIVRDARKKKARWPQDVLRHSYATHWIPMHHDKVKLAGLMGNSPDVIEKHYKALVTAKEAAAYWNIMPEKSGRIIRLAKSA